MLSSFAVAGVERNVVTPGFGDGADDVEGPVAVEGSDLDGDHSVDFGEPTPEAIRQVRSADRFLKVEADERDHLGHGPAMSQPGVIDGGAEPGNLASSSPARRRQGRGGYRPPGDGLQLDLKFRQSAPACMHRPADALDQAPRQQRPNTGRNTGAVHADRRW